ncbi:sulfatase-like hydrolase/transferase [Lutimonas zeaxanthinifaciens]|uniref:sulfatase-like hydrolase/transferase n=1 Tax=Lutimonas zeaxanthinifaciens TaxID=3060215 RepID=UPI00265D3668|nr:sulfatase-like hydrolase/transferase [Lutimonas sp. YSD2104]WKK65257.1 sulfatase-like hydrolase/transferase [Lutimonas sp. YSD2104]
MKSKLIFFFVIIIFIPLSSFSQVNDAPFEYYKKRNQDQWKQQDNEIDKKLADLEKRFGKKPNIIYILTDDIGWGELGWQGGGKHRGTPTPALDKMAFNGMRFWSAYAEPSCTPTRIAINTGRHPVRTGLLSVLWPGQKEGLSPNEVTTAELLSDAGYHTAMWGKWHMGDEPKHAPENQGYDYAYYGLFNGAPDAWQDSKDLYDSPMPVNAAFYDFPGYDEYEARTGIDLSVAGYIGEKGKGRKPIEGAAGKLGVNRQEAFENETNRQMISFIKEKNKTDQPFYIYWASYALQITGSKEHQNDYGVDKRNAQASMMVLHNMHVDNVLNTLKEEGIEENTLVIWISDNGPMYAFYPTSGYTLLRGAKGDVLEGGVRVPAMAYWPGMIEPNQDPNDIIHVTDLYTTACRVAGIEDKIPTDRITDGIDQTALLLLGEGNGRRNYITHYSGSQLGAIRYEDFKVHIKEGHGGLPGMDFYNIKRDPGEKYGKLYPGLFAVAPIQMFMKSHMELIQKYPHRDPKESH